jgi:predicted membrane-bound spermidine synthase
MILLLFFCSGATALVYEVLWSKHLALMFGSTVQAQTVVLAVFMGGLALGNRLASRWADGSRYPLKVYGYLEIAIALYACGFSYVNALADRLYVAVGSRSAEQALVLLLWKTAFSAGLLLLPTVLMGATLPFLAAWLQQTGSDAGRRTARIYATNSLGAVVGAGLAGFFLVQRLGMEASQLATALVNAIVGALALAWGSRPRPAVLEGSPTQETPGPAEGSSDEPLVGLRWGCWLVAFSGGISMGLEVLGSRSLALLSGASLQSFALVLMAFILGIALGSARVASPSVRRLPGCLGTAGLFLACAVWIGILALAIEYWVDCYRIARLGLARNGIGYFYHQLLVGGLAMVVLGLPAGLLGAVLPLWIRIVSNQNLLLGGAVGRLLTWNTLGAVGGSLATGFLIMPLLGLRGAFGFMTVLLGVLAVGVAWRGRCPRLALGGSLAVIVLALGFLTGGDGWRYALASGAFRIQEKTYDPAVMAVRRQALRFLFYEDAPDATVVLEQSTVEGKDKGAIALRINGKTDASTTSDLATQYLMAHLPMALHPESREVFVLGFGSGITAGALLGYPEVRITIAENCKPVLRAAPFFAAYNRNVHQDPRARIRLEDARTVLKLSPKRYDLIISEPSNPWTAGIGSVFSREFFDLAASRLGENGLMAQWFHVYEMSDGIVALVIRTFQSVFPHLEVWDASRGDIILVGSRKPWTLDLERMRQVFTLEEPAKDLRRAGILSPEFLLARQLASQRTAFAIAGEEGPIQSDAFPILEYAAPRAFYQGGNATVLQHFDERTFQWVLAPREKREVLALLGAAELTNIFNVFLSVNTQLDQYIKWYAEVTREDIRHTAPLSQHSLPSIFRKPPVPFQMIPPPENATPELLQLWEAEKWIFESPERTDEALEQIRMLLGAWQNEAAPNRDPALATRYAILAARTCFSQDATLKAAAFVDLGLQFDPREPALNYYRLILNQELDQTAP